MLTSILLFAFAATGLAQTPATPAVTIPEGYRKVLVTSMVNVKFVMVPKTRTNGSTVVVQTRSDKPEQFWWLKDGNTTIQLADAALCLDAGAKTNWKDMANLYIRDCVETEAGQKWNVMADGRIALVGSTTPQECVDLQYMRATENNPVGLYQCAGLGGIGAADKGLNWPLVNATA